MLDIIIDVTDGTDALEFEAFLDLFRTLLRHTNNWGRLSTPVDKPVGIDSLPAQLQRKSVKRGFEFNLMVVGESAGWASYKSQNDYPTQLFFFWFQKARRGWASRRWWTRCSGAM